jgi:hypothetical protein
VAIGALLVACRPAPVPGSDPSHDKGAAVDVGARPTPAPPFGSIASASLDEILRYARGLEYDTATGASDRQALAVQKRPGARCPDECEYGALARIQPEIGSVALADADVERGRIIGRIINEGVKPYDKVNLGARDTVYLWVQQTATGPSSRFVSSDPKRADESAKTRSLTLGDSHPGLYTRAVARWIWVDDDEQAWVGCGTRCCRQHP